MPELRFTIDEELYNLKEQLPRSVTWKKLMELGVRTAVDGKKVLQFTVLRPESTWTDVKEEK